MKVTLLFPGQGAQYVGMGNNLKETEFYSFFKKANEILKYSISDICSAGPEDQLKLTENTQPALLTHSVALFEKLKPILAQKNIEIAQVLGHSVGEYAALVAAGVMKFEDAVKAVHLRGKYMQEAVPVGEGKMIAILKLDGDIVKEACRKASTADSQVMPANFNDPKQIVISGHAEACDQAVKWLEENVKERFGTIPLQVSAPFHSTLMKPAAEKMTAVLSDIKFTSNTIPYVANIDAKKYDNRTDIELIRQNLIDQICGSVLWTQSIQELGITTKFIEVGPGKVLAGLVKRILPDAQILSLDTPEAFTKLEEFLA